MIVNIYPSGTIAKGSHESRSLWTDEERDIIRKAILPHSVRFFNPNATIVDLINTDTIFGSDLYHVKSSDFVIVDGRDRRGIGVGVEMLAAKIYGIPLIAVCPLESHYRRRSIACRGGVIQNYIHPHIIALADIVTFSFGEAGRWISDFLRSPSPVKDISTITRAIEEHENQVCNCDRAGRSIN